MQASHTCDLDIEHLPVEVTAAHIFPNMQNKCLISLGVFADNGYNIHLTETHIYITHLQDASKSLMGYRDAVSKMWTVDVTNKPNTTLPRVQANRLQANNVYEYRKKKDIITYLHKAAFSPVKSTWIKAINAGFFHYMAESHRRLGRKISEKISSHSQRSHATDTSESTQHIHPVDNTFTTSTTKCHDDIF